MVVRLVTHATNQPHQAMGIGLVHFAVPKRFTCGTEFVAGGDDGDTEACPYRDGRMAHGGAEADLRRREVGSGKQACGPFAQVLALLPNESCTNGCGQGHLAIPDVAALDGEDGVSARRHRSAGHDAHGMPWLERSHVIVRSRGHRALNRECGWHGGHV